MSVFVAGALCDRLALPSPVAFISAAPLRLHTLPPPALSKPLCAPVFPPRAPRRRRAAPAPRACAPRPAGEAGDGAGEKGKEKEKVKEMEGGAATTTATTTTEMKAEEAGEGEDGGTEGAAKDGPLAMVRKLLREVLAAVQRALAPWSFVWGIGAGVVLSLVLLLAPLPWLLDGMGAFGGGDAGKGGVEASLREKVFLYDVILNDINAGYVDSVDVDKLFEASISGMLSTLDPFSQFESSAEAVEMNVKTSGRYGGVGLGISSGDVLDEARKAKGGSNGKGKRVMVVNAFEGYAYDAGIRPGDVIETVNGKSTEGLGIAEVTDMLRGEPGTAVEVGVLREGWPDEMKFKLERRRVQLKDVPVAALIGDARDGVGYIRLQSFAKDAAEEVRSAMLALEKKAKAVPGKTGLNGLVLDLRGNPGGLLDSAIKVTETIVPRGSVVVSTKGRGTGPGPIYLSNSDPVVSTDLPIAVLVNGQTASASEVVAGAVQDLDRGIIVGSRSYGKGLVQQLLSLPYSTALKYTSGRYFTPSGRCIQALSYSDKDVNGQYEAKAVPDSERKRFLTRHGRIVRDGGGIEPDVVTKHQVSFLESALTRQNMFFHFASRYAAERKLETLPIDFAVEDSLYRDFIRFVTSSDFKYESRFDEAFGQLDEMFSDVGYEVARGKVADLRKATIAEMRSDFSRHEKDIKVQIESAIRFRLQPDSIRLVAELRHDDQLREAVRLLRSPTEYATLLAPKAMIADSETGAVATAPDGLTQSESDHPSVPGSSAPETTPLRRGLSPISRRSNS